VKKGEDSLIKAFSVLEENQKKEINELVSKCLLFDGLEKTLYLENDLNIYVNMKCFYLYYVDEYLVSVLTMTQIDEENVEITGYTLPMERNKGYFIELLDYAEEELIGFDIKHITFVVEPSSKAAPYVIEACYARYMKSEYLLAFDLENLKENMIEENRVEYNSMLYLEKLSGSTKEESIILSAEIFHNNLEFSEELIEMSFEDETGESFLLYKQEEEKELIGICNIVYGSNTASIFGLGIRKEERGKGYGRILLQRILMKMKEKGISKILLEVGSQNEPAFKLYTSEGFYIKSQYDYYQYDIEFWE
jgi:ribosomal protein S18 acetylase RimI-like enzyme